MKRRRRNVALATVQYTSRVNLFEVVCDAGLLCIALVRTIDVVITSAGCPAHPIPALNSHCRPFLRTADDTHNPAPKCKRSDADSSVVLPGFLLVWTNILTSHLRTARYTRNDRRLVQGSPKIIRISAFLERRSGQRACYLVLAAGPVIGTVVGLAGWIEVRFLLWDTWYP